MSRNKEDRNFLHEIAGPMTIIRYTLRKLHANFQDENGGHSSEECKRLLAKALEALRKIEDLHANKKMQVSERELEDEIVQKKGIA